METILTLVLAFLVGYGIGAFPTAYLVGRINGINIFTIGSGNMGATNVSRALGFRWAALVFVVDFAKGCLAVLIARALPGNAAHNAVVGGLAGIIGHNWSIFVALITGKLRGGKGAATSAGTWVILFAPWWYLILFPALVLVAIIALTRYVSLGVMVTATVAALGAVLLVVTIPTTSRSLAPYGIILALMIFYRHRENIQRLREGRERRLGEPAR